MRDIIAVILFALAIVICLWAVFAAPCEIYMFTPAGEIPGRCVMEGF